MAARYWVGGGSSANWNATGNTNWGTASNTRDNASVPTAADDVIFDNSANGNSPCTINAAAVCRSFDTSAFTNTITHNAAITLTIGDASAGAGNVAINFGTFTYTLGDVITSAISFQSTYTAVAQTVNFNGKTTGNVTFGATSVAGKYQYTGGHTVGSTSTVTLTKGTLDINGQTCNFGYFSSNVANTRTLTLGSAAITITGSTNAWITGNTSLTITANTAVITMTNSAAGFNTVGYGMNGTSLVMTNMWSGNIANGTALKDFTISGGSGGKTAYISIYGTVTCTGTLTITGSSAAERIFVQSNTVGTPRTLSAAAVSLTNVDFMDVTGAGAAAPFTGTSLGDCGGNSGITFDASVAQTWSGTSGGNWSTNAWTTRVPLPQDDVTINAAFSASQTITSDMPRSGRNISFVGVSGNPTWAISSDYSMYGSLTLATTMTLFNTTYLRLRGRGSHTLTCAGRLFEYGTVCNAPGGTYTLQDDLSGSGGLFISQGTFDANGYNVRQASITSNSGNTRTIKMGSGTWTLTWQSAASSGSAAAWNVTAAGLTVDCSTSSVVLTGSGVSTVPSKPFYGAGYTYYTLTDTTANMPGGLTITGANTFTNLNVGSGRTLTMPSSTAQTIVGDGFFQQSGIAGSYASAPDSVPLSITGDIDIRAKVALTDWTPTTIATLVAKWVETTKRSYLFRLLTDGTLKLDWSTDGTSGSNQSSTVATGFVDGTTHWVRATLDVNNGAAGCDVKFYTSDDGISWTQLGTTRTYAFTTSIYDNDQPLEIGSYSSGVTNLAIGKFYRVQVRNNILDDGTGIQFDADFTGHTAGTTTFTESSVNAATMTVNGTSSYIYADGTGTFNAQGTNNGYLRLPGVVSHYVSAPDSVPLSITGDITLIMRMSRPDFSVAGEAYCVCKYNGTGNQRSYILGWLASTPKVYYSINGTTFPEFTASATVPSLVNGTPVWVKAEIDVDNGASNAACTFYYSHNQTNDDAVVTWTQLGSVKYAGSTISFYDSTASVEVGSINSGNNGLHTGNYYRTIIASGIGGGATKQFDADFTTKPVGANTFTESSANAATVTINGALAQVGDGRVSLVSSTPGTPATLSKSSGTVSCNYLSIQDSAATGGASWYAGAQSTNVSGNSGWIFTAPPTGTPTVLMMGV